MDVGQVRRELGEALSMLTGRTRRSGARRVMPWVLACCWLGLAFFCAQLVLTVRTLRIEVADRAAWLVEADRARTAAGRAVHNAVNALPPIPPAERARLAAALELELRGTVPTSALREAARAWGAASASEHAVAARVLAQAGREYDEAITRAIAKVRSEIAPRSVQLGELWDHLYMLAAACVGIGAAFTWIFLRALRQRERLEINTRAQSKLIETVQSVIFVISAEGKMVFVNEAAYDAYGYEPHELIGKPFIELIDPKLRERDLEAFGEIMRGGSIFNYETTCIHKSGRKVPMLYNAALIRNARGTPIGCIGTATDISELKSMQSQIIRDERQHALGTMASGVAHDFSNLLTVILGKAERELSERPGTRRLLAIRDTAERARRLVERLLVFSEQRTTARSRLDLSAAVERMTGFLENLLGDHGTLVIQLPGTEVEVDADWSQFEQVVMNLVLNARDAVADDGEIRVRVTRAEIDAMRARELGIAPGSWGCLEVIDDGSGMDTSTLGRAFEPFFTTKERGQGTGLGLATVQGIVEQHGGVVDARSRFGEGTVMTVLLPLSVLPAPVAT
ncbi:MAG: two-component system sensor histidine kinase NtrB [Planctomycetota bacterium]|jgi:PAS domain S-box-containing protein